MHHFASWANVVQTFCPVTRQPPFSCTAFVFSEARSEPDSGSEKPWHQISSPDRIGSRKRSFCSSAPVGDHDRAAHHQAEDVRRPRRLRPRQLLAEDRLLDQRRPAAAVLLRPRDPGPARGVELALPLALELELRLIATLRRGARVVVGEPAAELVAERLLFGGQGEVHRAARTLSLRTNMVPGVQGERFEATTADGRKLEAIVAGPEDGDVVLMHHGTPGSAHGLWPAHVEKASARGLRLVGYSRPGSGTSDRDPGRSVASCATDAASVADALDAERFFTTGGSGGGPHALACAALLPDRVIAAATIAGVAPVDAEGLDWLEGMGEENHEEFAAAKAGPDELEEFMNRWAPELRAAKGPDLLESLGDLVSPPDAAVLTGEYAEFAAAGFRHALSEGIWVWFDDDLAFVRNWGFDLGTIEVPVSIWQGRQDRFVPGTHGEWLAANVAGATGHLLDDHGHLSLALAHFGEILDELKSSAGIDG